jgi:hypothetical protein
VTRAWLVPVALGAVVSLVAVACGGKKNAKEPIGVTEKPAATVTAGASKKSEATRPPVSFVIATVGDKSIGPFATRRDDVGMAVYVGLGEANTRRVVSVPLGADGNTRGDARVVAPVTVDVTALAVRPTRGTGAGFVAAWTSLTERGEALSIAGIDDAGAPRGAVTELSRTTDDIVWFEVLPTPKGAVAVWAEETRGGDANVLSVAIEPDGHMRGVPVRVARGVLGWQVTAAGDGLGLALVMTSGEPTKKGAVRAGTLSWVRLDADGRPLGAPVVVQPKPTVSGDVDVARLGDRYVFAWTDRSLADPEVTLASVGEDGAVQAPRRALSAAGGSALVGLSTGPAGGLLAWDAPNRRGRPTRRVYLAHIDPLGELDGRAAAIDLAGRASPELAATQTGFALTGAARAAEGGSIPTFVRFDANLTPVQTEPLLFGMADDREVAHVAWGLSCNGDRCSTLAAANADPLRVRSIDLAARTTTFVAPVAPPVPTDAPRLGVVTTLAQGEPYADVAVAKVGDGSVVALLTTALDDASQKKNGAESAGATITTRQLDAKGVPVGAPFTLSTRALTIGGVAIAPGATPEDGAAIAWVAREAGDPQVHVTRVDKRGKRQNDVQLTTTKGDAADVAIAWAGGGWIVAWVDWRGGNGEVFATKVGPDLSRIAREERLTDAPGDASDVTLLARGDAVWLAWTDPRESPADGFADVFVTQVRAKDAKRAADEQRVLASAAHSRSPVLAGTGENVWIAWIEEAPAGADAQSSVAHGAMLARLDERGKPKGGLFKVRAAGDGFPSAITIEGTDTGLRGVLARGDKEQLELDSMELRAGDAAPRAFPLLTLDGPPSLDASLVLHEGALYYYDDGPEPGDRRARRASILWKK